MNRSADTDPLEGRRHYVYRLYGDGDLLLYVGCTSVVGQRLYSHWTYKTWADDVRRVTITPYPTRSTGRDAEALALATERPVYDQAGEDLPRGRPRRCRDCRYGRHERCDGYGRHGYPCSCTACAYELALTP